MPFILIYIMIPIIGSQLYNLHLLLIYDCRKALNTNPKTAIPCWGPPSRNLKWELFHFPIV